MVEGAYNWIRSFYNRISSNSTSNTTATPDISITTTARVDADVEMATQGSGTAIFPAVPAIPSPVYTRAPTSSVLMLNLRNLVRVIHLGTQGGNSGTHVQLIHTRSAHLDARDIELIEGEPDLPSYSRTHPGHQPPPYIEAHATALEDRSCSTSFVRLRAVLRERALSFFKRPRHLSGQRLPVVRQHTQQPRLHRSDWIVQAGSPTVFKVLIGLACFALVAAVAVVLKKGVDHLTHLHNGQ